MNLKNTKQLNFDNPQLGLLPITNYQLPISMSPPGVATSRSKDAQKTGLPKLCLLMVGVNKYQDKGSFVDSVLNV